MAHQDDIGSKRYDVFLSFHGSEELRFPHGQQQVVEFGQLVKHLYDDVIQKRWVKEGHVGALSLFFDDHAMTQSSDGRIIQERSVRSALLQTRGGGVVAILASRGYFESKCCLTELLAAINLSRSTDPDERVRIVFLGIDMTVDEIQSTPFMKKFVKGQFKDSGEDFQYHTVSLLDPERMLVDVADLIVKRGQRILAGSSEEDSYNVLIREIDEKLHGSRDMDAFMAQNSGNTLFSFSRTCERHVLLPKLTHFLRGRSPSSTIDYCNNQIQAFDRKWRANWCFSRDWDTELTKIGVLQQYINEFLSSERDHGVSSLERPPEKEMRRRAPKNPDDYESLEQVRRQINLLKDARNRKQKGLGGAYGAATVPQQHSEESRAKTVTDFGEKFLIPKEKASLDDSFAHTAGLDHSHNASWSGSMWNPESTTATFARWRRAYKEEVERSEASNSIGNVTSSMEVEDSHSVSQTVLHSGWTNPYVLSTKPDLFLLSQYHKVLKLGKNGSIAVANILSNITEGCRRMSIQMECVDEPAAAVLRSFELVVMELTMWKQQADSGNELVLNLSHRQGEEVFFIHLAKKLLSAAEGKLPEEPRKNTKPVDWQLTVKKFDSLLEQSASKFEEESCVTLGTATDELQYVFSMLKSGNFVEALECLSNMVDLSRTMIGACGIASRVVLLGDNDVLDSNVAQTIQKVIMDCIRGDVEVSSNRESAELRTRSLSVLAKALNYAAGANLSPSEMSQLRDQNISESLLGIVRNAAMEPHDACRAVRCLYLMYISSKEARDEASADPDVALALQVAQDIGTKSHAKLGNECSSALAELAAGQG